MTRVRFNTFTGLWASAVLIVIITAALLFSMERYRAETGLVHHTRDVLFALSDTLDLLQDAESAQRGFLLTGNKEFLNRFEQIEPSVGRSLADLARLTSDNPKQRTNIEHLAPLAHQRVAILNANIELRRTRGLAAVLGSINAGKGRAVMRNVRAVMSDMKAEEEGLRARREADAIATETSTVAIVLAGSASLFLLVATSTRAVQREMRRTLEAQREQREIAGRLSVTLSSIGDAVIATDAGGRVTFLNAVAADLTGWSPADAVGKKCAEIFRIIDETTKEPVISPVDRVLQCGGIVTLANHTELLTRGGRAIAIDDSGAPIRDAGGGLIGVILVFRDVSERRRAARELAEAARLAALRAEIGGALNEADALTVVLDRCAECIVRHLEGSQARLWILADAEPALILSADVGSDSTLGSDGSRIAIGEGLIGRVADERRPYCTNAAENDLLISNRKPADRGGLVAVAAYPLVVSERLLGVLAIYSRRALSEAATHELSSVADQIALGIERKRTELTLQELNVRLQRAMAESHHRIKNNLQMLAALVDMQRMNSEGVVPVSELERLGQHIRTLASIHDLLTAEAKFGGDTEMVSLPQALGKLVSMLRQTAGSRQILVHADDVQLPLKQCGPFILLVNELISNAIKHGRGDIRIELSQVSTAPDAAPGR